VVESEVETTVESKMIGLCATSREFPASGKGGGPAKKSCSAPLGDMKIKNKKYQTPPEEATPMTQHVVQLHGIIYHKDISAS